MKECTKAIEGDVILSNVISCDNFNKIMVFTMSERVGTTAGYRYGILSSVSSK